MSNFEQRSPFQVQASPDTAMQDGQIIESALHGTHEAKKNADNSIEARIRIVKKILSSLVIKGSEIQEAHAERNTLHLKEFLREYWDIWHKVVQVNRKLYTIEKPDIATIHKILLDSDQILGTFNLV